MTLEAANIQWPQGAVYQTGDRGTEALGVKDTVLPVPDNVVAAENFETNPITGSGTWILDTTLPHTGLRYLRSAVITDNQSTNYTFPVPALATSVRFWHRVSSEAGFDFFKIYKNSISVPNQLFQLSGLLNTWQLFTVSLAGITSIIVEYSKDSSASAGLDAAFIDDIEWFIPGTPAIQNFEPYHLDTNNRVKVTLLGETIAVTGSLSIGNEIEIKNDIGNPVPVIFAVPQHTIVDSGTVVATQGTTPWVTDDLTFASDKVDVSGSVITVTIEALTFAEDKVDVSGSAVTIEPLTFLEDKVDVSGSTVIVTQGTDPWNIDDLTFASDKVDVSGSSVTIEPLTFAEDKVDVSGSSITIEALTFAEDKVDVSGSSIVFTSPQHVIIDSLPEVEIKNDSGNPVPVNGTVTVNQGTNPWNIDDLTFAADKVDVSGSSVIIEALTFAEDKVDVSGSSIVFTSPQHVIVDSLPEVEIKNDSGNPIPVVGTVLVTATANLSNIADSATSVTLQAANSSRKAWYLFNDSTSLLMIKFGATASKTSFTVAVPCGGYYEMPNPTIYTGVIDGIWTTADGGAARVTELV